MNPLAIVAGLAGLAFLANKALESKRPWTQVVGPSGTTYGVALGEAGPGGQLCTVYNTDAKMLFVYVQQGMTRSWVASNPDAEPGELAKALTDFGVMSQ